MKTKVVTDQRDKPISVLHVMAEPLTGSVLVSPIAKRQHQDGYTVDLCCSPGQDPADLLSLGLPVAPVPIVRRLVDVSQLKALYSLWRLMRRNKYRVVHVHTPIAAFLGRLAASAAGVPIVIYHMRGSWWESPRWLVRNLFTAMEWIAGRFTTHVFTINCTDARDMVARRIVAADRVTCLHCGGGGVDMNRFDAENVDETSKTQIRAELGLSKDDFVIAFIGRLVKEKGIIELIHAFRKLVVEIPQAKLVLVGGVLSSERDHRTAQYVEQLVSTDPALAARVIFTGFRKDIPRVLAVTHLLVLPSHREGFGMVLAEAGAMKVPVITTDTRGGREAVTNGVNGYVVRIGDSAQLAYTMLSLALDEGRRREMGEAGRRIALERFDERVVFEKIQAEYARLLRERGFPVPGRQVGVDSDVS